MQELIQLSKSLSKFIVCAEGNISQRIDDSFLIKASGAYLSALSEEDIVKCGLDGKQLDNFKKKPSMEYLFHSWFYKLNNINFIAHTHPTNTLKILCTDEIWNFSKKRMFPDQVVFNGKKSCVVPYGKPGKQLLFLIEQYVTDFIKKENEIPKLILLQNHGIIALGSTAKECKVITEICDKSAEIYLTCIKDCKYLSDEEIEELTQDENEKYRRNI